MLSGYCIVTNKRNCLRTTDRVVISSEDCSIGSATPQSQESFLTTPHITWLILNDQLAEEPITDDRQRSHHQSYTITSPANKEANPRRSTGADILEKSSGWVFSYEHLQSKRLKQAEEVAAKEVKAMGKRSRKGKDAMQEAAETKASISTVGRGRKQKSIYCAVSRSAGCWFMHAPRLQVSTGHVHEH